MPSLRVGLVGYGRIAELFHLGILDRLPGAELAAIAEPDPARRAAAGRRVPRAELHADPAELVTAADIDALVVCSPPATHAALAIAALEAGRHVYVEKPLATHLADADAVHVAWRRAGTVAMTGFNFRFHPLVVEAKRLLGAGAIGEPIALRTAFTSSPRDLPAWKRSRASGGGVLLDLASHQIDLARFLFDDEVEAVQVGQRSAGSEGESAALQLHLRAGPLVQTFVAMGSIEDHRLEIYGRSGRIRVDLLRSVDVEVLPLGATHGRVDRLRAALRGLQPRRVLARRHEPSFALALAAFVDAARAGRAVRPDLEDGCRSLAVVEAAERAAASGGEAFPASAPDVRATEPAERPLGAFGRA